MIAKLTGTVDSVAADSAVIDVAGVGYLIHASRRTLTALGRPGEPVAVVVETQMREDRIQLFGFIDVAERDWFRLLTAVQGVGGRMALAVLSVLDPAALTMAIAAQDRAALSRADGVGAKLAGRIAAELRDKVDAVAQAPRATTAAATAPTTSAAPARDDAVSALVNLGYSRSEAFSAVAQAVETLGAGAGAEALIPAALKTLVP